MMNTTWPPLLLLPGTACDQRVLAPVLYRLGHGAVAWGRLSGACDMPELARQLLAQAPPKFALLGFSLGGIAALEMAAQAPDRILGLALLSSTARPHAAASVAPRRAAVARARQHGMDTFILDAWAQLVAPSHLHHAELQQTIVAMARDCGPDVLHQQIEIGIQRLDSRPRLSAISQPTVVLAGASDQVCLPLVQAEIAQGIAGAQWRLIANAGHFLPLEQPDVVALHLRHWLNICATHANHSSPSP